MLRHKERGDGVYLVTDKSEVVGRYAKRPEVEGLPNPKMGKSTWDSFISYNPKNDKLVTATQGGEVLNIIDLEKKSETVSAGPKGKPFPIIFNDGAVPWDIDGFGDLVATDNYIYALFLGLTRDERLVERIPGKYILRVYDYHGMPVRAYDITQKIISFHVDEAASKIYATVDDEEDCIFVYDI